MTYPDPKYFDYSASTPPFQSAMDKFLEISGKYYANPSSMHHSGRKAKQLLLDLKTDFYKLMHFHDGRLLLCSSATEANNTVLEGLLRRHPGKSILVAEDTHESIWYIREQYPERVHVLPLESHGQVALETLAESIGDNTLLVCMNHVCNETGNVYDIEKIGLLCAKNNVKLLIDGTQAVGHIPVNLNACLFDYYTFSAHKFGGVRSVGGIFMRDDEFAPLLSGGKQEWEMRAGTENVAGLAAAIAALRTNLDMQNEESLRLSSLAKWLEEELLRQVPEVVVNSTKQGLPGLLSLSFPRFKGNEIVAALSLAGFSVSTGSACHANAIEPSRIVMAMGRNRETASGTIRISMGYGTTEEAAVTLLQEIKKYVL